MDITLILVPYDTARRSERMGAGPEHLLRAGAVDRLRAAGHRVDVEEVTLADRRMPAEIAAAFELQRGVAAAVQRAAIRGSFPIVLSGNCNMAALGMLAGLATRDIGVWWLDAHGDFNTPETTVGGFLDGMALAMATGRCWREMLTNLADFAPVPEENVVLLGVRDLDRLEASLLAESPVTVIPPRDARARVPQVVERLRQRVTDVYLHIDLDVLDPVAHGRANQFAVAGGLTVDDVGWVIELVGGQCRVRGAALTAYDPGCDADDRVCRAALGLLTVLADAVSVSARQSELARFNAQPGRGG
jgi:arginase